jgi:NAD(P)-dependent dehydrogenase (short-subunit alcohol dehydrogenase family)
MAQSRGTALVTGAARRVGRGIALALADLGFDVVVHCRRSTGEAAYTARAIEERGRRSAVLEADLEIPEQASLLIGRAAKALGTITLLVNNAAIFELDRPDSVSERSWSRHIEINLHAPFLLIQSMARELPDRADGLVVNIIDQRVLNLTPNYTSYSVAKAGLLALTRHLALALAPRIRVNAIGPGVVLAAEGMSDEQFGSLVAAAPLRRATTLAEMSAALRMLIETPSLTGQMLALDAGLHLGWLHPGQDPGLE